MTKLITYTASFFEDFSKSLNYKAQNAGFGVMVLFLLKAEGNLYDIFIVFLGFVPIKTFFW